MTIRPSNLAALLGLLTAALVADAQEGETVRPDVDAPEPAAAQARRDAEAAGPTLAANASLTEADPLSTTPVDEEVVVRGQLRRGALRMQIERAEEAFYGRFNDINSNDELDIHCRSVVELGSRIPRRRCEPNFWRAAEADFARETVIGLQGGYASDPQAAIAPGFYKHIELEKEMRELAAADAGLREALARLATLQQAYASQEDD